MSLKAVKFANKKTPQKPKMVCTNKGYRFTQFS